MLVSQLNDLSAVQIARRKMNEDVTYAHNTESGCKNKFVICRREVCIVKNCDRSLLKALGSWGLIKKKKKKRASETTPTESMEQSEVTGFRYTDWPQAGK